MRKTYGLIALAAVALAVAAFPRSSEPRRSQPNDPLAAEVERLKTELAAEGRARKREIAELEAKLRAFSVASARTSDEGPVEVAPGIVEPVIPEQEQPVPVDHAEPLEAASADQTRDASWA